MLRRAHVVPRLLILGTAYTHIWYSVAIHLSKRVQAFAMVHRLHYYCGSCVRHINLRYRITIYKREVHFYRFEVKLRVG